MNTPAERGFPALSSLYAPLVGTTPDQSVLPEIAKAASFLARRLAQTTIPYEDLLQEGLLACVLAVHSFDPASGASFPTYALHLREGAIIA